MKDSKKKIALIVASTDVFDFLREKVGERKTRTEAYCDLLDKSLAGFVSEFQRRIDYDLKPNQCHVTISGLAEEWHWHRATVRSFLEMLEQLGQLEKVKLPKSIVITMPIGFGKAFSARSEHEGEDLSSILDSALSDWVIGKMTSVEVGVLCEQIIHEYLGKYADSKDNLPSGERKELTEEEVVQREASLQEKAMVCVAHAALARVLCKARFGDISPLKEYFRSDLGEEWGALIDTFKVLAELLVEGNTDILGEDLEENAAMRDSLYNAFRTLLARTATSE